MRVVDLFAGVGGLTAGALEAGAEVVLAVDADPMAAQAIASYLQARLTPLRHSPFAAEPRAELAGRRLRRAAGAMARSALVRVGILA